MTTGSIIKANSLRNSKFNVKVLKVEVLPVDTGKRKKSELVSSIASIMHGNRRSENGINLQLKLN